jgi:hypothetical protein
MYSCTHGFQKVKEHKTNHVTGQKADVLYKVCVCVRACAYISIVEYITTYFFTKYHNSETCDSKSSSKMLHFCLFQA